MSTIEEQLWNYIDGICSDEEKTQIEAKIASNLQYNKVYQELMIVHQELNKLDFEEPSMSFTRNVMDKVELELAPVALKTKIDNRIVYSIGIFFVLSILGMFGYIISISNISFQLPKVDLSFTNKLANPIVIQVFLMVDVVLGLLYLDSFLRKRKSAR